MDKKLQVLLKQARGSGSLALTNQKLKEIPTEVFDFSNLVLEDQKWWELNPLTKIDLSYNLIEFIPNSLSNEKDLQVIRLSHNKISNMQEDCLKDLNALKSLDLKENQISVLPQSLSDCISLVELQLTGNHFNCISLPTTLTNLEIIFLNDNRIEVIPDLTCLIKLKKLDLSGNNIKVLNKALPKELKEFSLQSNKLEAITKGILRVLINLVSLDLSKNKLKEISELPNSKFLDSLNLSFNQIFKIEGLGDTPNLSVLTISTNKINEIPPAILTMNKLTTLDLSNNDINTLPSELGLLKNLLRIVLDGNPLRANRNLLNIKGAQKLKETLSAKLMPTEEEQKSNQISSVRDSIYNHEVALSGMKLNSVPEDIYSYATNIFKIDLSRNNLPSIDLRFTEFESLADLNLNDNKIQEFPEFFSKFKALKTLSISKNNVKTILSLPLSLERLDLSWNRMGTFPNCLGSLKFLYFLELSGNGFQTTSNFPNSINELYLNDNKISTLDNNITELPNLEVLCIENNDLSIIPSILGFKDKIRTLKLEGNPQKMIRRQVLEKGTKSILEYLKSRHVV